MLAAIPWFVSAPVWPHALAWLPLAWWSAWSGGARRARVLATLSFVIGSLIALAVVQPPTRYAFLGLPAWSAALGLAASLMPPRT